MPNQVLAGLAPLVLSSADFCAPGGRSIALQVLVVGGDAGAANAHHNVTLSKETR